MNRSIFACLSRSVALAAALLLCAYAPVTAGVDPADFFEPTFHDLPEELAMAARDGKRLVIMFEQEGCPFCWKMRRDVLNKKEVHDYYHKLFRVIQMDIRGSLPVVDFDGNTTTQKEFSIAQNVRHTPVFIYYGEDGKELHRLIGFYSKKEFLLSGKYVESGAYATDDFFLWLKKRTTGGSGE